MTHIEKMKQWLEALELVSTEFVCNGAHHAKKDRHGLGELCPIVERYEEAITSLRQAIKEFDSHTLYREGYVNGYAFGEAAGRKAIAKQDGVCQHCAGKGCVACDARKVAHDLF
jgi:hypothetical protein